MVVRAGALGGEWPDNLGYHRMVALAGWHVSFAGGHTQVGGFMPASAEREREIVNRLRLAFRVLAVQVCEVRGRATGLDGQYICPKLQFRSRFIVHRLAG